MPALLEGIRILDLTTVVMGPMASQLLGDMGADVVKVEAPGGDISRQSVPRRSPRMGQAFLALNRNKRSLVIDLKHPEGLAALLELVKTADVLLYNVRPQAMTRLGLSYEDVKAVNEKIIYVGGFGFSQRGPYAARPAYDDIIQGMSGIPALAAMASGAEPRYAPMTFVDRTMSVHVALSVMGALFHRGRTGRGQSVQVPMFETIVSSVMSEHLEGVLFEPPIGSIGHARSISPERRPYRTSDGYMCTLIYNDGHWRRFLGLLGMPEKFDEDERFSSHGARMKHINAVCGFLADALLQRSTKEWLEAFAEADIPASKMYSLDDIVDDEHLRDIGFFTTVDHPTEGKIRQMMYPAEWSDAPATYRRHAPTCGQHSVEILREAGFAQERIDGLVAAGAVRTDGEP